MPSLFFLFSLALICGYGCWTFFSQTPFIQQEAIGQAFWYACDGTPLLHTLFEPFKNDEFPGRFRYVEYLFEAGYWNLVKLGWLPRNLYDYSAILVTALLMLILYRLAKQRKLTQAETLFILAVFLLSTPTFMIITFHYRKAKFLVSLLLGIMATIPLSQNSKGRFSWPLILLSLIGVYTDPYFILMAPVLMFCLDLGSHHWKRGFSCLSGIGLGLCGVILLNGVIGPAINPNTQLLFGHLQVNNQNFLNIKNLSAAYSIVLDTLAVLDFAGWTKIVGWLLTFGFGLLLYSFRKSKSEYGFLAAFLLTLPLCAYLVLPDRRHIGIFASYYGHPVFFLFVLSLFDLFEFARRSSLKMGRVLTFSLILVVLISHQRNERTVFSAWKSAHIKNPNRVESLYARDSGEVTRLQRLFKDKQASGELNLDFSRHSIHQFTNAYNTRTPEMEHTTLGYVLTPILFQNELKEGRLRIIEKTASTQTHWVPLCGQSSMRF